MQRLLAVVFCLVAACATVQLATPSGRPEVTIPGVDRDTVKNALVARLSARGWSIASDTDYSLVAERSGDTATNVVFGAASRLRITYQLVSVGDGVTVYGQPAAVTQNGFGAQQVIPLEGESAANVQLALEEVRAQLGGEPVTNSAVQRSTPRTSPAQ